MTALARDRYQPVDRDRGQHTTRTYWIRHRRRPSTVALPRTVRAIRIEHDVDPGSTAGRGRLGDCY
jgi:hypothetical protein